MPDTYKKCWKKVSRTSFVIVTMLFIFSGSQSSAAENTQIPEEVLAAADALGLTRGARGEEIAAVNYEIYTGVGRIRIDNQWVAVSNYTTSYDYVISAARIDITTEEASENNRQIEVIRENRAWDESRPGISEEELVDPQIVLARKLQVYATPTGAITAAVKTGNEVDVSEENGRVILEGFSI